MLSGHAARPPVAPFRTAQLSPRTFCTFLREFSSFQASKELLTGSDRDPGYGSDHLLVPMGGPWFFRLHRQTDSPRVPVVGTAVSTAWSRSRIDRRACLA
jgi:hypothetical protein